RSVYLPAGTQWIHVWSGESFAGGQAIEISAPFGQPPVFYRPGGEHDPLFQSLRTL
ncbi:hypothetical protein, partial [Caulobacter sp. HMWF025]|uniref:hypothetical protein n=1 Tax=Caulobacter sp. HMWF025 TaxID=2056860 RepID=UPI003FA406E2